jgi:flagellar biosynthesis protein FlhF
MLESLGRANQLGGAPEVPGELFHLFTDLIDAEVEEDLARDLVFRVKRNCTEQQLADTAAAKALLTAMVESEIRCSGPITPSRNRRKVVALVGATGVGKTTTIAKMAANFRLREGVKIGLVTVDTYRIAAVEQLRTYAEIIDELIGLDLVLIDTAGRSPRDDLQIQELKRLLNEADVDEVQLVLNMTSSLRSLEETIKKFEPAHPTSLIMTKLDEAAGLGTLLSLSRRVPLPISYLTTGQDVPEDIEPANPARVARLVLGQETIVK